MYLKTLGLVEIESRNKYTMLKKDETGYFFIGKNGAVRYNSKKSATDSISVTDKYKAKLLVYERTNNLMEVN